MKLGKLIAGIGIGTVVGMLLAPKKGSELRSDLKDTSMKAYDRVKNMSKEDMEAVLGDTIEKVKKTIDEFDVDEFKATTKEKLAELQTKLEKPLKKSKKKSIALKKK